MDVYPRGCQSQAMWLPADQVVCLASLPFLSECVTTLIFLQTMFYLFLYCHKPLNQ